MRDIYCHAVRVRAWLGDADVDSNFALDYVKYCSLTPAYSTSQYWRSGLTERARQALKLFLRRPYWDRMWIIQEIALASELVIMSGSRCVSWHVLVAVVREDLDGWTPWGEYHIPLLTEQNSTQPTRHEEHVARFASLIAIRRGAQTASLMQLVTRFMHHSCTDPWYKIHALLGIPAQMTRQHLRVDYKKHKLEVYLDLLSSMLSTNPVRLSRLEIKSDEDKWERNHFFDAAWSFLEGLCSATPYTDLCSDFIDLSWRVPCYKLNRDQAPRSDEYLMDSPSSCEFLLNKLFPLRNIDALNIKHTQFATPSFVAYYRDSGIRSGDVTLHRDGITSIIVRPTFADQYHEFLGLMNEIHP